MTNALTDTVIDAIHEARQKRGATKEDVANAAIVAVLKGLLNLWSRPNPHDTGVRNMIDALIAQHRGGGE